MTTALASDAAIAPAGSARAQEAFYRGFLVVLVAAFTPFKAVGFLLPIIFTAWMLVFARDAVPPRRLVILAFCAAVMPLFYTVVADEFLLANYGLALLTYSGFFPLVILDSRLLASRRLLERCTAAASVMVLVQGIVGTVQAVYGATQTGTFAGDNGDIVAGTIYPHLSPERAFGSAIFVVNMTVMIIVGLAIPGTFAGRRRIHLAVGIVSVVLASVVHALVFLVAAVLVAWILTRPIAVKRPMARPGRQLPLTALLMAVVSYFAIADNVAHTGGVVEKAVDLEAQDVPRSILLTRVLNELSSEQPLQPFVGLGPGQFSSRASLIATGLYLGGPDHPKTLPLLSTQATRVAEEYCVSLLIEFADQKDVIGSSEQPFFSALSIYTELGAMGLIAVTLVVFEWLRRVRRRVRTTPALRFHAGLLVAGLVFMVLLGVQDNYWETPQAMLVGFLLLKLLYVNVLYSGSDLRDE